MKTKEFIEKVETLGYRVDYTDCDFSIKLPNNKVVTYIWTERWEIDATYGSFEALPRSEKKELMAVVYEFMLTDPADRKEEKRYWLRLVTPPILKKQVTEYLRKSEYLEYYTTGLSKNTGDEKIKTIFTESEIAEMDITGFKKEPVE